MDGMYRGEGGEGRDTKEGMSSLAKINSHKITSNANHYLSSGWLTEGEAI